VHGDQTGRDGGTKKVKEGNETPDDLEHNEGGRRRQRSCGRRPQCRWDRADAHGLQRNGRGGRLACCEKRQAAPEAPARPGAALSAVLRPSTAASEQTRVMWSEQPERIA
jgi:hypothetical protein